MKLKIGEVYKITHSRKGSFVGKLLEDGPEWCRIEITEGMAEGIHEDWVVGEKLDMRKSLVRFESVNA